MSTSREKLIYWGVPILVVVLILVAIMLLNRQRPIDTNELSVNSQAITLNQESPQVEERPRLPSSQDESPETEPVIDETVDQTVNIQVLESCQSIQSQSLRHQCEDHLSYNQILQSKNSNECSKLHDPTLQSKCEATLVVSIAIESLDKTQCDKIVDAKVQSRCLDDIELALAQNNEGDCREIEDEGARNVCLDYQRLQAATKEGDTGNCSSIEDPILKDQCQGTIRHNQQVLANVTEQTTSQTNQQKLVACDSLTPQMAQACKDKVYFELAFEEKDIHTHCNNISSPPGRQSCLSIQGDKVDRFYLHQAIADSNPNSCNSIENVAVKAVCLDELSMNNDSLN